MSVFDRVVYEEESRPKRGTAAPNRSISVRIANMRGVRLGPRKLTSLSAGVPSRLCQHKRVCSLAFFLLRPRRFSLEVRKKFFF